MEKTILDRKDLSLKNTGRISEIVSRFGVYFMLILLVIAGVFVNPKFLSLENFRNIIHAVSFLGIISSGMAFITYSGHYADMSVPINIALSGILAISGMRFGFVPGLVMGVAGGLSMGVVNAVVVGKLRANPIIWTLAMNFVVSGIVRWAWSNKQIYPDVESGGTVAGDMFTNIARTTIAGIPLSIIVMVVLILAMQFVLVKTRYGRQLKVIGSNYETARMSGINVTRCVGTAYIITALMASLAGIFITSFAKVGAYYNGEGYDFKAVTAIILGGMTLSGGRGNMLGVLGGVLTVGLLSNIMTLIGIGTFEQQIITGIIFIAIVWVNTNSLRRLGRDNA